MKQQNVTCSECGRNDTIYDTKLSDTNVCGDNICSHSKIL